MNNSRKFLRFPVSLGVEARGENQEGSLGQIKDFSRQGARLCFDRFDFDADSSVELKIQRPGNDVFVPAMGKVMWKRPVAGKWEAGVRLVDFPSEVKIEILEHGYNTWLKANNNFAIS